MDDIKALCVNKKGVANSPPPPQPVCVFELPGDRTESEHPHQLGGILHPFFQKLQEEKILLFPASFFDPQVVSRFPPLCVC